MCGEKVPFFELLPDVLGSPPHVRGKDCDCCCCAAFDGITPACAGKRLDAPLHRITKRDHPRMCGEKLLVATPGQKMPGSPPHVRGKGGALSISLLTDRITPACAGKSQQPST